MFCIPRIYDSALAINREAIRKVQQILKDQFDDLPDKDIEYGGLWGSNLLLTYL